MKNFKSFRIREELGLFDAKWFLMKTFVAVMIGYLIGNYIPILHKDMISLLFGMMLTIEPTNITGIRTGFSQVKDTLIGATVTGIILAFLGYNAFSVALSVTATLAVCLLLNWRSYSVIAVFTSIYMSQYVQFGKDGMPNELETIKVRILALTCGVAIAILVNWIFSWIGYRNLYEKRLLYILKSLRSIVDKIRTYLDLSAEEKDKQVQDIMADIHLFYSDLQWISSTIGDIHLDRLSNSKNKNLLSEDKGARSIILIRDIINIVDDHFNGYNRGDGSSKEKIPQIINLTNQGLELVIRRLQYILNSKEERVDAPEPYEGEDISLKHLSGSLAELLSLYD